ncbi:hypothetical protein [Nonomuraea turkmeniaca]|nr:hypothetical protein [Nonomuraea turkmeniaca]
MLRKRLRSALAVGCLVVGSTLIFEAPAQAASSHAIAKTNGTRAAEVWFNRANGSHGNSAWFDLYDAKCDAKPVYVTWKFVTGGWSRWESATNDGGCGNTMGINLGGGGFTIDYKVCVDDGFLDDSCSGTVRDHN